MVGIVAFDQPKPARLHDLDTLTQGFEARPDWFVRGSTATASTR